MALTTDANDPSVGVRSVKLPSSSLICTVLPDSTFSAVEETDMPGSANVTMWAAARLSTLKLRVPGAAPAWVLTTAASEFDVAFTACHVLVSPSALAAADMARNLLLIAWNEAITLFWVLTFVFNIVCGSASACMS
jgi:hypothetical protein